MDKTFTRKTPPEAKVDTLTAHLKANVPEPAAWQARPGYRAKPWASWDAAPQGQVAANLVEDPRAKSAPSPMAMGLGISKVAIFSPVEFFPVDFFLRANSLPPPCIFAGCTVHSETMHEYSAIPLVHLPPAILAGFCRLLPTEV